MQDGDGLVTDVHALDHGCVVPRLHSISSGIAMVQPGKSRIVELHNISRFDGGQFVNSFHSDETGLHESNQLPPHVVPFARPVGTRTARGSRTLQRLPSQ